MPSLKIDEEEAVLQPRVASGLDPSEQPAGDTPRFASRNGVRHAAQLLLAALGAVAISGYHPFGEDAGIYVAGIKSAANPGLYGNSGAFIAPYLRVSLFPQIGAWLVRSLHLPLEVFLFAAQILTTWLLLFACWELARHCFDRREERWAAVLLTAACLSIPVAGTSLFLMDPYLTSRSFSTPLSLLAIAACLDRSFLRTAFLLLLIGLFHPLMVLYAAFFVLLLWAVQVRSRPGAAAILATGLAAAAAIHFSQRTYVESIAYQNAVLSRYYFFLSEWQWYELFGLAAPVLILAAYASRRKAVTAAGGVYLAKTCVIFGLVSIALSLLFARPVGHSHLIAALQPLRPFLLIYFCMFLLLGGLIGGALLKRSSWLFAILLASIGTGLAFAQHQIYPASAQVELPGLVSHNGWTRAFLWIRDNTPQDARFALDADYIRVPGEDSQGFRAIAERGSLADQSKDGGAAAVFRQLADRWWVEQTATTGLNQMDDSERLRRLAPFHVDWVVLNADAPTHLDCPFIDDAVRVCRLR